jgi:hypothetical protein
MPSASTTILKTIFCNLLKFACLMTILTVPATQKDATGPMYFTVLANNLSAASSGPTSPSKPILATTRDKARVSIRKNSCNIYLNEEKHLLIISINIVRLLNEKMQ